MSPMERLVVELTGRRYARRSQAAMAVVLRVVATAAALGLIWAALVVAFLAQTP